MSGIPDSFGDFIAQGCDRPRFIQEYLEKRGVESVELGVDGKRHVYVKFPPSMYNPQFRMKIVAAHHDRAPGTPGANDNSAAVFCLMDWAVRLAKRPSFHNVRVIFTDGEERAAREQGAFELAALFKKLGITNEDVYVFDCVGRGTVPVLGKAECAIESPMAFRQSLKDLSERAERLLRSSCASRWLSLPVPYSDNAGFIARGIPAVAITMLPEDEASRYTAALIKEKSLADFVVNKTKEGDARLREMLPDTWRLFHTPRDTAETLCAESFQAVSAILDAIACDKCPL